MTVEMMLGTAQLGSAYGINNQIGELNGTQAFEVLAEAFKEKIYYLDTAEGYGRSETLIGEYLRANPEQHFNICTKLSRAPEGEDGVSTTLLHRRIEDALLRLACTKFIIYYLHSFKACMNKEIMKVLRDEQSHGRIERIGVSLYEPHELRYILDHPEMGIGAVQIPFNLLNVDQWTKDALLLEAKQSGVMILARSAYVQGLVFKDPHDPFVRNLGLEKAIQHIWDMSREKNVDIARLACDFVRSFEEISYIVLGCETAAQVSENAAIFRDQNVWTEAMINAQMVLSENISPASVDPRMW